MLKRRDLCKVLNVNSPASRIKLSPRLFAAVLLLILPALYFYPALTGEVALVQGDGWSQNLGVRVLIGRMIAAGDWPLWNPYIFAGMPLLASIYPGALYPPNWLFALLSPGAAMHWVVITTYHIAIIGSYFYGRKIGMTRAGALIAGIVFSFGGYMISHLGHTSRIAAGAWLPWILLSLENLHLEVRWRWIIGGAAFIALQLFAGEPQMTFYTVLVAGGYFAFSLLAREVPSRARFVAATAAMSVGGLLLSMMQLLPERELLRQSERAAISYEYFSGYSFPPRQILTLIFPYFFGGSPTSFGFWGEWTAGETCGYVGLMTLLLSFVALFARGRKPLVWFWTAAGLVALVLALGDYLPFGLNALLYRLPVYNLFRASARHLFEFDFSAGVLAGLGVSYLARSDRAEALRAFRPAAIILIVLVAGTAIAYRFFGSYLVTTTPRPTGAESLLAPEGLFPLVFLVLTVCAVWVYARSRSVWMGALLVAVLFADLGAFGHRFYWRVTRMSINKRLADPETVKFIKEREPDLNAFRIVSYSSFPFYYLSDEMLNFPNVSIARGLQSVNGYDALRLLRPSEMAGAMTLDGQVEDPRLFGKEHEGLNLLNVKYLFYQPPLPIDALRGVKYDGVRFEDKLLNWNLTAGTHLEFTPAPIAASSLALVTTMSNSTHIPDESPVARIRLQTADGRVLEHQVLIGRDTSEWAYDRDPGRMRHRRAKIAETWDAGGFQAHRYLSRFEFPRTEIVRVEFDYVRQDASLLILRASYYDSQTGHSMPVDTFTPTPARWRKLATFGRAEVYENLRVRPRAWFVGRLVVAPRAEVIEAIKTGLLRDGTAFDPSEVALLETEDFGGREIKLPPVGDTAGAEVRVSSYAAQRIVIETSQPQAGFLVLSEIYYRGWEAWVDGVRVPVERVNYALRGVAVPPGHHRLEMVFRAHSFRTGALYSAAGASSLLAGALITHRRRRRRLKTVA